MRGDHWIIRNPGEVGRVIGYITQHLMSPESVYPAAIKIGKHEDKRSLDQNSIINCAYGDISRETGEGVVDVRRRCKLHYGVPILRAHDEAFRDSYDEVVKPHTYEAKLKIMDFLPVTSRMKKPQASEYLDTLFREHPQVRFQERAA